MFIRNYSSWLISCSDRVYICFPGTNGLWSTPTLAALFPLALTDNVQTCPNHLCLASTHLTKKKWETSVNNTWSAWRGFYLFSHLFFLCLFYFLNLKSARDCGLLCTSCLNMKQGEVLQSTAKYGRRFAKVQKSCCAHLEFLGTLGNRGNCFEPFEAPRGRRRVMQRETTVLILVIGNIQIFC